MGQEQLTLDLKIQPEPKQLTLDLQIRPEPSLENFAPGDNAELVSVLTSIKREGKGPYFLYLWGVTGSGRIPADRARPVESVRSSRALAS